MHCAPCTPEKNHWPENFIAMRTRTKSFLRRLKNTGMVSKTLYRNTLTIIYKYSVILTIFFIFQGCSTVWFCLRSLTVCHLISKLCHNHYKTLVRKTFFKCSRPIWERRKQVPKYRIMWNWIQPSIFFFFFFSLPQMPSERFLLYSWKILHYLSWLSFVSQGHFSFQVFVNFRKFLSFVD